MMVLISYLSKPTSLCNESGKLQTTSGLLADAKLRADAAAWAESSLATLPWSFLGILKGGADVVNSSLLGFYDGLTEEARAARAKKEERQRIVSLRMKNADTLEQWQAAARELDRLEDNEAWKFDDTSSDFDAQLIEARLAQLDRARTDCDVKQMLLLVRTALSRDLGGMGNIKLYKQSYTGTKDLIERYIDSTLDTIRSLVGMSKVSLPGGLDTKEILEQVVYARQSFGRSALLLSGGGTFGMNHIGVLKALFEAKLLPRIISGASAGSIVCSVLCTRIDEEIPEVLDRFPYGDLAVFDEDGKEDGILDKVRRLLTRGAWIDEKHLTRVMHELLQDITFQEAYNRTRKILNITVSSASIYELPRLLNYITSPNVMIWSAVAASCSLPLCFSAASLLMKDPASGEIVPWNPTPQQWIDGSVDNDLPMTRLAEMFNVNHFIVSQVNPHVVPFLLKEEQSIAKDARTETGPSWASILTNLAKHEALHRMQVLAELGIFPNLVTKARSILSQKYSGDITILPQINYKDFPLILSNPTSDFMVQALKCGERATWPKLSRIRNHCAVELELDIAVQHLRARVVFSPSQTDLRRMTTGSTTGPPKRIMRKRGESTDNVRSLRRDSDEEEGSDYNRRNSASRPNARTTSSHWSVAKRFVSPIATSRLVQPGANVPYYVPQQPDPAFADETTTSPRALDAGELPYTNDVSCQLEAYDSFDFKPADVRMLEHQCGDMELLSTSQPVMPNTDTVLATPVLYRTRSNTSVPSSPGTNFARRRNTDFWNNTVSSNTYKKSFHSSQDNLQR